jgi:hypothetical protein
MERRGRQRSQQCMDLFRDTLEHCLLRDLGYEGDTFTWCNHHHAAENYIRERLDRVVANDQWRARFPAAKVINGDPRHSDHRPLIITTERSIGGGGRYGSRSFKFEANWLQEEKCREVVEEARKRAMEELDISTQNALKVVTASLSEWSHNVLGDLEKRVKKIEKEVEP